jgi:ankyrin repeat protein
LEKGADARAKDKEGATPLHHAAKGGRDELVRLLVKHGAAVDETDGAGRSPLEWAGREQTKALLVELGAKAK